MFGPLGIPEVIFILVLALLVFGPKRLPEIGRTVGKAMGEFRRASNELKRTINTEIALEDDEARPAVARRPSVEAEGGPVKTPARPQPAIGAIAAAAPGAVAAASVPETPPVPAAAGADPAPAATPDDLVGAEPVDTPVPAEKAEP